MADITGGMDNKRLLGQNPLEEAAKDFNAAVDKLAKIYDDKIKPGIGAAHSTWTGKPSPFSRQSDTGNGGSPTFSANSYGAGTTKRYQYDGPTSPYRKWLGQAGPLTVGPVRPVNSYPAPRLPNGGGPSTPTRTPGQVSPGSANGGGAAAKAGGLGATFGALSKYGSNMLQRQLPMDQYVYQGSLGMTGNLSQNQAALRRQAFGANNQNLNAIANGNADAAAMYTEAGRIAGTPLLNQTQSGRALQQSMNLTGITSPYMSGAQNAQVQSNIYNPQTSLQAMRMGLMTPRQLGTGKIRSLDTLSQSWMGRLWGGKTPTMKEINATFGEGGRGRMALSQMGLSDQSIGSVENLMKAQQQVQQRGGNWNEAKKLIDKAAHGDTDAGEELQNRYGLSKSLVQSLKNKQAAKTGRDSDTSASFNKALSDATDTLQKFSKALTAVMNKTGITGALGTGGAWASQLSGSLGGFGGALQGIGGLYGSFAMGKMLAGGGGLKGLASKIPGASKFLGGSTAARAAAGVGSTGLAAEGAGAAGGMALGPTGVVAALALPSIHRGQSKAIDDAVDRKYGKGASKDLHPDHPGPPTRKEISDALKRHSDDGQSGGDDNTTNKSEKAGSKGKRAVGNATAAKVIQIAEKYIGRPYHYGGNSPKTNFDCSGLTQWSFKEAGMTIPRTAKDQQAAGKNIPKAQVRAGDLIFKGNPAHHVALMVSNKKLIEAPHTGADIRERAYKPGEWTDARRIIGAVGNLQGANKGRGDTSNNMNEDAGGDKGDKGDAGGYGSSEELTGLQNKLAGGASTGLNPGYSGVTAYATGTKNAKDGVLLTGERGAEIVETRDGKTMVWNAKQTAEMLNNSKPMHDMLMGAGLAGNSKSTGNTVNLNFSDNAIVIKAADTSSAKAGTTSKKVIEDIDRRDMYAAIAQGKKN